MEVKVFPTNLLGVNCYVIYNGNQALIVDPGGAGREVVSFLRQKGLAAQAIVNTHGHADHVAGNAFFVEQLGIPILIHAADATMLINPQLNMSRYIGQDVVGPPADRYIAEQQELALGDEKLTVLHTPGHTPGGICLYSPGMLISGDTLFRNGVGRVDLPGGSGRELRHSLQRLSQLPQDTLVYPGHGPQTSLGDELANLRR